MVNVEQLQKRKATFLIALSKFARVVNLPDLQSVTSIIESTKVITA